MTDGIRTLGACLRIVAITLAACVVAYTAVVLGIARALVPESANGSLITNANGEVVGSRLIAQAFDEPAYFWPRPSAVGYDGSASGGSNLSPTSERLTERARALAARYGATPENALPPELATASGSGLDPHISESAARYQLPRIVAARGLPEDDVEALIERCAFAPGGYLTSGRLVNVLELNLALDSLAVAEAGSGGS